MSPKKSPSRNTALPNRVTKPDRDCDGDEGYDDFYMDNFTEQRPPNLNGTNFPSTQPSGSTTQPRKFENIKQGSDGDMEYVTTDADGNYTFKPYVPSSVNTDSTPKYGDPFARRLDLNYHVTQNYTAARDAQPLTQEAIAALNYRNDTEHYGGNVYGWLPPAGPVDHTNQLDYLSNSLMPRASKSRSSLATSLSWCIVPSAHEHQTADILRDVGRWSDIPADPNTSTARNIRDEDVFDN